MPHRFQSKTVRRLLLAVLSVSAAFAQQFDYDAAGRLVRAAYPGGDGVAYSYDDSDNMTAAMPLSLPAAPTGVEVTRLSPTSARVAWAADPTASGYVVERLRAGASQWEEVGQVGASILTFTDSGLEAGADYAYRISAIGADGRSAPSVEATFGGPPGPSISENGIVNGASFSAGQAIAPGSIISVFGDNIGVRVTSQGLDVFSEQATTIPLPLDLGGASLSIGGKPAPIFFVGGQEPAASTESGTAVPQGFVSGQVNAQTPWDVSLGVQDVVFTQRSGTEEIQSPPSQVAVALVSPALFTFDFGAGRAVGLNVKADPNDDVINGSIAQPVGDFPGVATQPAKLGGVVTLFANGLGPVDPEAQTGNNSLDALRSVTNLVRVFIGNAEAQVLFAGLSPQFVGLYQINILIPVGALPGDAVPIRINQGGLQSRPDVTIAIRP